MVRNRPLQLKTIQNTRLGVPGSDPWHVALSDPALSVMTDFHERSAITVDARSPIDAALEHMKHAGVRAALAVDQPDGRVVGMITAYDILGEKPTRHLESIGCTQLTCSRDEVLVADIMEPVDQWQVVDIREVEQATVEAILETFRICGRSHLAVVQTWADGGERLRGLFSAAKIGRLVGTVAAARTWALGKAANAEEAPVGHELPRLEAWQRLASRLNRAAVNS